MSIIESFIEKVRGRNLTVVLPEGSDERIILAARKLKDENIANPVVIGKPEKIAAAIEKAGVNLDGITTIKEVQSKVFAVSF